MLQRSSRGLGPGLGHIRLVLGLGERVEPLFQSQSCPVCCSYDLAPAICTHTGFSKNTHTPIPPLTISHSLRHPPNRRHHLSPHSIVRLSLPPHVPTPIPFLVEANPFITPNQPLPPPPMAPKPPYPTSEDVHLTAPPLLHPRGASTTSPPPARWLRCSINTSLDKVTPRKFCL